MDTDLRKINHVSVHKDALAITAGGGCKAVDLETPLQGMDVKSLLRL